MSFPVSVRTLIRDTFNSEVQRVSSVGGGCINETFRIVLADGQDLFVKQNRIDLYDMFEKEAAGLRLLDNATDEIRIPGVHAFLKDEDAGLAVLILSFIEEDRARGSFDERFGQALARLHQHTAPQFGLDHDNYIGRLPQKNSWRDDWPVFFAECRLETQMAMAQDNGYFSGSTRLALERLYKRLPELFPVEPPALLHGDLWGGNYLCDREQRPVLIDPAIYYGHREAELAFTQLFGEFGRGFYEGYSQVYPLEPGFHERKDIYNIYPLLVHVNLFGGSYVAQAEAVIRRY